MFDLLICLKTLQVSYIDVRMLGPILRNNGKGILNLGEPALAQDIKLMQPNIFRDNHIKLYSGKTFGRQEGGAVVMQAALGNQYPACMNAQVAGKPLYVGAVTKD